MKLNLHGDFPFRFPFFAIFLEIVMSLLYWASSWCCDFLCSRCDFFLLCRLTISSSLNIGKRSYYTCHHKHDLLLCDTIVYRILFAIPPLDLCLHCESTIALRTITHFLRLSRCFFTMNEPFSHIHVATLVKAACDQSKNKNAKLKSQTK